MKQPSIASALSTNSPSTPPSNGNKGEGRRQNTTLTAQEIVSYYESQGLDTNEASLKAIENLQNVLVQVVGSGRGKKGKFISETGRKLDNLNTRLAVLEMKLDTKPGYRETAAIGVASGLAATGFCSVLPHVLGALGQMWDSVKGTTRS